jgi:hypothetical protein
MRAGLKAQINKTDRNDARGIADIKIIRRDSRDRILLTTKQRPAFPHLKFSNRI